MLTIKEFHKKEKKYLEWAAEEARRLEVDDVMTFEEHQNFSYFEEISINEVDKTLAEELVKTFGKDMVDLYKDDVSWLLEGYLLRLHEKEIFEENQK